MTNDNVNGYSFLLLCFRSYSTVAACVLRVFIILILFAFFAFFLN